MPRSPGTRQGASVLAAVGEWPFLGRGDLFDTVTEAVQSGWGTGSSGVRGAVVVGPAGVGKTRLLAEVRRWAERSGLATATVIATEAASGTPYGCVLHLLTPGAGEPTDLTTWHATVAAALRPGHHRTVLLVDDAHHLDRGTAALVLQLVLEGMVAPVIAVRSGESVPDPVTSLWTNGLALRLDLPPFREDQMRGLIDQVLEGPVSARTLSRLAAVSNGNILYAKELVAAALDGGSLRQRDGVWTWDERVLLAPRLVDAVWGRLQVLTDEQRRALALVALGEPLPVTIAEALLTEDVLTELESTGLVRTRGPYEQYALRLTHPLYGEVALNRAGRLGRRALVARLADAFEADPTQADPAVVRIASWRLEAGQQVSPTTLVRAASRANLALDHRLAARLARAALDALDASGPDEWGAPSTAPSLHPRARDRVILDLAGALVGCNRVAEAHELLVGVAEQLANSTDPDLVDGYLDARYRASCLGLGRVTEFQDLLDHVTSRAAAGQYADPTAAYRAAILLGAGRAQEAVAEAAPLVESGTPQLAHLLAMEVTGEALVNLGMFGRTQALWQRMHALSEGAGGRVGAAGDEADLLALFAAQLDGRIGEILPAITALHAQVENSPDVLTRGLASFALGRCLLLAGHPGRARPIVLDAVNDFRTVDLGGSLSWALATLSQIASLTHQAGPAREWLAEARDRHTHGGTARQAADLAAAAVWLSVVEGDRSGAARLAREGAARYPEFAMSRAHLLHLACRVGDRGLDTVAALRAVATQVECDYPTLLADHAEALHGGDGHRLESVADRFAARGLELLAAEAARDAARAHHQAGSTEGVRRASAHAAALDARLDGVHTPALEDQEWLTLLSPREQDVARLAAHGLSDAAIAERLVLSVRTVESHLYQTYAKLGIHGRGALIRYLPDGRGTESPQSPVQPVRPGRQRADQ